MPVDVAAYLLNEKRGALNEVAGASRIGPPVGIARIGSGVFGAPALAGRDDEALDEESLPGHNTLSGNGTVLQQGGRVVERRVLVFGAGGIPNERGQPGRQLAREGHLVQVVERERPGSRASWVVRVWSSCLLRP